MSDLPRLYSFEELLESFPVGKMSERTLRGAVMNLGYEAAPGRRCMAFSQDQFDHIRASLASTPSGVVYFLRCGNAVKVGYSEQFSFRLAELQTGNPVKLEVYKTVAAPPHIERHLHKLFRRYRIRGEWFKWCPIVQCEIDAL